MGEGIWRSAVEQAAAVAAGDVTAAELTSLALGRAAEIQPRLNPFTVICDDTAPVVAATLDAARTAGTPLPPLAGVTLAIKDFTPTRGLLTTYGSRVFEGHLPDRDAVIVERLRAAGTVLIGKTTTPEFAGSFFTRSSLWGVTRNPWDPARNPGGSSGGSAVAVASGAVALAEGCDMGGSVRGPAADCGIVGLKPSFGRIPFDILPTAFDDISHFGPIARTVGDCVAFLRATAGPHMADPQSFVPPLALGDIEAGVRGLRIGVTTDFGFYRVDDDVAAHVLAVAETLRAAGAEVVPAAPAWEAQMADDWFALSTVWMAALYGEHYDRTPDLLDPLTVTVIEMGRKLSAVEHKRIELTRSRQWRALADYFSGFDLLLCPTMAVPPPPVEAGDLDFTGFDERGRYLGPDMTALFNAVPQCPVISVPAGMTAAGLPTGAQIVGRPYDEASVLRAARVVERERPWRDRHPPV